MSAINVFQQNPGADAKAQSPLHHADLASLVGKGRKNAGVTLREKKFLGHLTLRGDGHDPAFAAGVHKALGLELPVALTVVANSDMSLQWMGPDEWLLIVPGGQEFAIEQKLRAALDGLHIQVVNVSGGQSLLELRGPHVREVLMKSTSYDVHPNNFPVGKAVGTVFAKSQLVIRRTAEDTWELVIRRSFADYWWLWLQDASAEYGLSIEA
ncbi:sarcosine oxidase subunit gamma family protein [Pseudomonas kermanshahensis]|jgi:sarcosine oxidase subunit gamma|uniref:Sarcosine oxidase subunit gamma family protein n=1 Tax=Pseudomonas kermanshahensis TaxID=2745482 RepID=A0ABU8R623_9PSED|nr:MULTISPECIES: sarcosine oxidase subunit gamma family protein [Pseudomonas]ATP48140.1 sarcosine oxidase subunit gamma family protein [Pseudomonas putida]MDE4538654.1 sarcosine oxidase subunit gamma family protein [Pseudomonas sp. ITEM 17296]USS56355.1 sarcosine oxidase subunit gamma family protein [Pseudomonas kermanshahensis]UVL67240.1 sarcosine oxidase subunit gamma family protein [Pseudomonas sp. B21-031]WEL55899.1 sarcosine oxidase subunit gamma family protein [Pseudomonas kermanshahensi